MGLMNVAAMLRGSHDGVAYGLTWLPPGAIDALVDEAHGANAGGALARIASGLGLDLVFIEARQPDAAGMVRALSSVNVAAVWTVDGVFSGAARLNGWSEAIRLSAADPEALGAVLAAEAGRLLSQIRAGAVAGAVGVLIADELASDVGWLVAPDFVHEALVPHYRSAVRSTDLPVAFHSDGDIRAMHVALAHAGFSAVHVAVANDVGTAAAFDSVRAAGMIPMGGLRDQDLHRQGACSAGEFAANLAAAGATIICDDGGLTSAEDLAAYATSLDAVREQLAR